MPETLLTTYEAGEVLRVTDGRVRQLIKAGNLRAAYRTKGGVFLLVPSDVAALKANRDATKRATTEHERRAECPDRAG